MVIRKPKSLIASSRSWHQGLSILGGLALLMFAISGILHPLMSWTGPKAVTFFPPKAVMTGTSTAVIPDILQRHLIHNALMIKVVPSQHQNVLQITETNDGPRRYFNLTSGEELIDYDQQHAIWLARHYTGLTDTKINHITLQTEFNAQYPWVNRLLPVYRVVFDTPDKLTAFIYTELGALGSLTNTYKTMVQSVFRALHTWSFLSEWEQGRVVLMLLFLSTLVAMIATGAAMIVLLKTRRVHRTRQWHRLIAYFIWLPLLMFSASGIYHLLHHANSAPHHGIQLARLIDVSPNRFGRHADMLTSYATVQLTGISVVEGPHNRLLYRLGLPANRQDQHVTRSARFDGIPIEQPSVYVSALTGKFVNITDRDMAMYYAKQHMGPDHPPISNTASITHFGPEYDFRNKRLPVWRIDYDTPTNDTLFIDPATGMQVDRLANRSRYERYAFAVLHKWQFLVPLIGRQGRDILMVTILILAIVATILGFFMRFRSKTGRR